ncbi:hypothetical protein [Mesorhizobium sp. LjNodule214]|uniref:hypothetical protein n=1 Tax=Mesorhizobium sp. LjNodule214 TaxID=3342252 RepID=UPI003ECE4E35
MMISVPFRKSNDWRFLPEFDEERRLSLEAAPAFAEIAEAIGHEISTGTVKPTIRPATDERLPDCERVQFSFSVRRMTLDWLFNSPCGLRAQFLTDAELGRNANSHLRTVLRPILLDAFETAGLRFQGPGKWSAFDSIDGLSSKIWIDELHVPCNSRDLAIVQWELAADQPGADGRGLCAPIGSHLVFLGAWINSNGVEMVLPEKITRHVEIHRRGYS